MSSPVRAYTPNGQERFFYRPGQIVPAGFLNAETFQPFATDMVVDSTSEQGNPYDPPSRGRRVLFLRPTNFRDS